MGRKYLGAHRWISEVETWPAKISQAESVHFAKKGWFRNLNFVISQLAKLSFNLVWLSSNGHNFFISTLICTPFEVLDSWLHKLQKRHIVCIKFTSRSDLNVPYNFCPLGFLHVRFLSLFFLLAFLICFWQRTTKLQSLDSSCKWASICFAIDYTELSLILDCFGDKKSYQKHQNLTQFD